uniref:Nucleoporin Nup159/Nup146 N-terminal domain-containing protein n=1 Tax=Romanomermis culicivorax TaxID=13658 RepID=A0A915KPI2_ROMCU
MLGFRSKGRFRISKAFSSGNITTNINKFLAVSNKYGLIFVVKDELNYSLNIVDTSVIRNHVVSKENFKQEKTDFAVKSLDLGCAVERIDCNCDGSFVSIVLKSTSASFALIYDTRCFLPDFRENASPLCNIRLQIDPSISIQKSCLSCFEWNPGVGNVFAVCGSDGTISTYQVDGVDKVTVEGTLQNSIPKAKCLSWSPKGKQLVVGYDDCSLSQFKPNLHLAKKIDPIKTEIIGFQATIVNICWLSTTHFIVLFSDINDQHHVSLLHITLNKDGPPTFKNFEDVCFGIKWSVDDISYILRGSVLFL